MDKISLYLPELLIVIWIITLVFRMNRRMDRIERELAAIRSEPRSQDVITRGKGSGF